MSDKPWRGIFVIVVTPFTTDYELDEESLRKEVRFCIEAGAEGLVGPANASEFPTLSDDERKRWLEIVISEAKGQIPVVAATTCGHYLPAVALSRWAQTAGADGVMAMPPQFSLLAPMAVMRIMLRSIRHWKFPSAFKITAALPARLCPPNFSLVCVVN